MYSNIDSTYVILVGPIFNIICHLYGSTKMPCRKKKLMKKHRVEANAMETR